MAPFKQASVALAAVVLGIFLAKGFDKLQSFAVQAVEKTTTQANESIAEPYINQGNSEAVTTISRGQPFFIHYRMVRPSMCNVQYNTSMISTGTTTNMAGVLLRASETWYAPGDIVVNEMFDLPPKMPLGHYDIIKRAITYCNGTTAYSIIFKVSAEIIDFLPPVVPASTAPTLARPPLRPKPLGTEPPRSSNY